MHCRVFWLGPHTGVSHIKTLYWEGVLKFYFQSLSLSVHKSYNSATFFLKSWNFSRMPCLLLLRELLAFEQSVIRRVLKLNKYYLHNLLHDAGPKLNKISFEPGMPIWNPPFFHKLAGIRIRNFSAGFGLQFFLNINILILRYLFHVDMYVKYQNVLNWT